MIGIRRGERSNRDIAQGSWRNSIKFCANPPGMMVARFLQGLGRID
jgi:hypothetical protein